MSGLTKIDIPKKYYENMLRVCAYCRVSTDSEEQLNSLEAQKKYYSEYIKNHDNWQFKGLYFDSGISAANKEKRQGLLKMVHDCEAGNIDLIVTKSISRFARNTADCLELVRKLKDIGVYIYFEKENINTGSMESELFLSIYSSLAQDESYSISENSKWSVQKQFEDGSYVISTPPFGYKNVNGKMIVDDVQAKVVKYIFSQYLKGYSTEKIADELNQSKVPTMKKSKWSGTTVAGIIKNEKYVGDILLQKTYTDFRFKRHKNKGECNQYYIHNHHEPIISQQDFEKANALLKANRIDKGIEQDNHKYSNRYAFSGRIFCGECGNVFKRRTVTSNKNNPHIEWACKLHLKDKEQCSALSVRDEKLKSAFVTMVNKLIFARNEIISPLEESLCKINPNKVMKEISINENKLLKLKKRKGVLADLFSQKYLEPSVYAIELAKVQADESELKEKYQRLCKIFNTGTNSLDYLKQLEEFLHKVKFLKEFDDESFLAITDKIVVKSRNEISFELKCGLSLRERI